MAYSRKPLICKIAGNLVLTNLKVFRKNQSRHYINDEVCETVKKVWSS